MDNWQDAQRAHVGSDCLLVLGQLGHFEGLRRLHACIMHMYFGMLP